jgi:pimeloyl-ACP methyl ester carboxylesterase
MGQSPAFEYRRSVVLVANGSADCDDLSDNLAYALAAVEAPVQVMRIHWGVGDVGFNIGDQETHWRGGQRMAAHVAVLRQRNCYGKIFLLGYSGGTSVVLEAAERLPPGSVHRIVLLSSGVSSSHDMRRALRATVAGIDNFSSDDDAILSSLVGVFGTNDLLPPPAAGITGFRRLPAHGAAAALPPLREHRWTEAMGDSGHYGNHLGFTRVRFLKDYVVPLLCRP